MMKFEVKIWDYALDMIKKLEAGEKVDIESRVKECFSQISYYSEELRLKMWGRQVPEKYLEMFDVADMGVIFDKYVTCDTSSIVFDAEESKLANDRAKCIFRVSCVFDEAKYLKALDKIDNEDEETGKEVLSKEYYQNLYNTKYDILYNHFVEEGVSDPGSAASESFDEDASTDEVVGYYIETEGDDAYKTWMSNLLFYQNSGKVPTKKDKEVTRILEQLYPVEAANYQEQAEYEQERNSRFSCDEAETPASAFKFSTAQAMYDYIKDSGDLYCPDVKGGTYVFSYNEDGAIAVYEGISLEKARELSKYSQEIGENGWSALLGPGGTIYNCDESFDNRGTSAALTWCSINLSELWHRADENTFSEENLKLYPSLDKPSFGYIEDEVEEEWIVGISGSEMSDVKTEVVTGTRTQVKYYLLSLVNSDRSGDNNWDFGTESIREISENAETGKLYAYGSYSECHMDYTATPVKTIKRKALGGKVAA